MYRFQKSNYIKILAKKVAKNYQGSCPVIDILFSQRKCLSVVNRVFTPFTFRRLETTHEGLPIRLHSQIAQNDHILSEPK